MPKDQQDPHGLADLLRTALYDTEGELVEGGFVDRWEYYSDQAIDDINTIFRKHGCTDEDIARIEQAIHADDVPSGAARALLQALGRSHPPVQHLIQTTLRDPLPPLRIAALQAGAHLLDPAFLLEFLNDPDTSVRAAAVATLGEHHVKKNVPNAEANLARALDDSAFSVRIAAVKVMPFINNHQGGDALLRRLATERDVRVRTTIITEIAEKTRWAGVHVGYAGRPSLRDAIGEPITQMLIRHLNHNDSDVRKRVAVALERVGGEDVAIAMLERLQIEPNREVRHALVHYPGPGYWRIPDHSLPILSAQLLSDPDHAVRVEIIYHLRYFGPEATPALVAILDDPTSTQKWAAADALKTAGDASAIPSLQRLLNDPAHQGNRRDYEEAIHYIALRAAKK